MREREKIYFCRTKYKKNFFKKYKSVLIESLLKIRRKKTEKIYTKRGEGKN